MTKTTTRTLPALGRGPLTIGNADALLDGLGARMPAEAGRPREKFRAPPVPHAAWKDLAIQLRAHMRDGRSIAAAGGLLGVTADKARRILAAWPLSKLGKTS